MFISSKSSSAKQRRDSVGSNRRVTEPAAASNHADMGVTDDVSTSVRKSVNVDRHIPAPFSYAIPRMRIHLILDATLVRLGTRLGDNATKIALEISDT